LLSPELSLKTKKEKSTRAHEFTKKSVLDVFEAMPVALNDVKAVDKFYEIPHTPGLNERIMDGKVLMRKVAAIAHALTQVSSCN
jgi:hypothetical protein